jgi:putative FmdB family regulatory protein
MPLYEYQCNDCHKVVEVLVRSSEKPECPECGSVKLEKQLSIPASPSTGSSSLPVSDASQATCGRPQCGSGCMFDS